MPAPAHTLKRLHGRASCNTWSLGTVRHVLVVDCPAPSALKDSHTPQPTELSLPWTPVILSALILTAAADYPLHMAMKVVVYAQLSMRGHSVWNS